ncbi:peptidylprolyl isomerase [Oleiagrimonas sp. C23AA]|uniref:peptidylprolyl isomerase n=1 Tax=Oleiagrimonas sp. C23AA TaxID=2719047 RepID=UPI001421BFD9|nr:peptidylprolyl isomerase [Oleiagrimonas sp. C23AA]NII11800.1 peptidylprolyl isomerase [Oleiagrimonas sp. C23AA]
MLNKIAVFALSLLAPFAVMAQSGTATKQAPASASSSAEAGPVVHPEVKLHTSQGDIVIELYPDKSPKSVANFLQYVRDGFYDGTVFHRSIPGYLLQGGLYTRNLQAKRTRPPVPAEADNGLSNLRGTVAVARGADPDSGTSQFFINLVDNRRLDYVSNQSGLTWGYTVFGKVISGMNVVDKIAGLPTHAQGPFAGDVPQPLPVIENASVVGEQSNDAASASSTSAAKPKKPASAKSSKKS